MSKYCCERMQCDLEQVCEQHPDRFDCPDAFINQKNGKNYGLIIHDGGPSSIRINFCPWCGANLPSDPDDEEDFDGDDGQM